jgi:D-alanyl-D-alanine carboxypeptidase/D-alanyl-D-alanine-endopeptidase (penicillin-binding protein 4)
MGAQHRHVAAARHHKVTLAATIQTLLAEPKIEGAHWGISVTQMDGSPVYALNDEKLFQPASNVKLFTTAAALGILGPEKTWKTSIRVVGYTSGPQTVKGDISIYGDGDAYLSDRPVPYNIKAETFTPTLGQLDLLAGQIAEQLAKANITTIDGDLIARNGFWPFYGEGWSDDDLAWGYGAPVTDAVINDNQIQLTISPGPNYGDSPVLSFAPAFPYYTVKNDAMTEGKADATHIEVEHDGQTLHVYGSIGLGAPPDVEQIAIDDPALYFAMALKSLLAQHGITVTGQANAKRQYPRKLISTRENILQPLDFGEILRKIPMFIDYGSVCPLSGCEHIPREIASAEHVSPGLLDDVIITNKESQNLHAELMLRDLATWSQRLAKAADPFSNGARVVRQFAIDAGVKADDFYFVDGSGLSTYDVATPRAFTTLLRYAAAQPWGADWRSSLPVGGVDGTLEHRFTKSPVTGKVFAKTGTLSEDRALSGYLVCASGKTVVFSILVGNHLPGSHVDREVMDKIVEAIAAAN